MKHISIIILTYLLFSCARQDKYNENILGDWILVKGNTSQEYNHPPGSTNVWGQSYSFYKNGFADIRMPKFEIKDIDGSKPRKTKYLGSLTQYRIERDSLFFINRRDSTWGSGSRILKLTSDSLILENRRFEINKFIKSRSDKFEVDKIILSTSGCYGSCPILNVIIESSGDVTFYGEKHIDKIGFYESKITKTKYEELLKNFNLAEFQKSDSIYAADWSDDEEVTTTFIKGDTIVKSISDYGKIGPFSLVWSYIPLTYLYQSIDFKKLKNEDLPIYLNLHYFKFEKNGQICDLTKSESFALWNYLRKGQRTTQEFKSTMNLSFARNYTWAPSYQEIDDPYNIKNEEMVKLIQTDGRLFKFRLTNKDTMTIDIGFNFFNNNKNYLLFRDKKEYDN